MKKFLIILIAAAILVPVAAHAFSFLDVINFGKMIIHLPAAPTTDEVKKDLTTSAATAATISAESKYQNWRDAFNKKDLSLVLNDSQNLYFTETEINYLVDQELLAMAKPVARDVQISFTENLISASGESLLKNLGGQFSLQMKIVPDGKRINLQVTRARLHNFYFPSFLAQTFLRYQLRGMIDFLYSDPEHQSLTVTVGNGFIQLDYAK
ncbi:MAG TPA: hypothetical protein VMD74_03750 [Candidatus Methylomirabilis sp.]|nr:hypothetical protein [Candidatus Methylomirabilis sp.]